jgi:hypothetical protein
MFKELLSKLFDALPAFGRQLAAMVVGPKTAILQQDLETDSALQQGLTFLAVSFAIAFIAEIPFFPKNQNTELMFGYLAIASGLSFILNVVLVIACWKLVGGKLAWKKLIVATCYFCGVSTILYLGFSLFALGAFKVLDPIGCQQMLTNTITDPIGFWHGIGFRVFLFLNSLAMVATFAWIYTIWGAYRELMQVSETRSAISLLVFSLVSPCLLVIQALMMYSTFEPRTTPAVPNDLAGEWRLSKQADANGFHMDYELSYKFSQPILSVMPVGNYKMEARQKFTSQKCFAEFSQEEQGVLAVQGSGVTLSPYYQTQFTDDRCRGKRSQTRMPLTKNEYQYKIDHGVTGWTLCLSNRLGEMCLLPK